MAKTFKVVLSAFAVMAAMPALSQMGKEGPVSSTFCFGGPTHTVVVSPDERFGTYIVTGGVQSPEKPFDAMGFECVGSFEWRAKSMQHKGYCVSQDARGDKTFTTDSTSPQGYSWEYLGGTGKFKGITGGGKMELVGNVAQVRQGTMQGCRRMTGTYKLP